MGETEDVMTAQETAEWLRVSVHTVRDWAKLGKLPGWKKRNEWRFSKSEILLWLKGEDEESQEEEQEEIGA